MKLRGLMGPGGSRGLQSLLPGVRSVRGGFDSHLSPPLLSAGQPLGTVAITDSIATPRERATAAVPQQAILILNPIAGRGKAGRHQRDAIAALERTGLQVTLQLTEAPGHATVLAREAVARGDQLIVAAGGDGTVHETALGMWESPATLGVLPMGSGNDFARSHQIPRNLRRAAETIRSGVTRLSDVGHFDEWTFFNTLGLGYTVEVTLQSRRIRWLRGLPLYLLAVLRSLHAYRSRPMVITAESIDINGPTYFVTTAIGFCEGGGFPLTPDALWDDGLFDLCIVDDITAGTALRVLPLAMKARHTTHPAVTMARVPAVRLTSDRPLVFHADGQVYETGRNSVMCTCLKQALCVRVPLP